MQVNKELKKNYEQWTQQAVEDLCVQVDALDRDETDRAAAIEAIFSVAHDLKGMGGSFDYPLMTEAGQAMCAYITEAGAPENCRTNVLRRYCAVLSCVIKERLSGDGGTRGQELLAELQAIAAD